MSASKKSKKSSGQAAKGQKASTHDVESAPKSGVRPTLGETTTEPRRTLLLAVDDHRFGSDDDVEAAFAAIDAQAERTKTRRKLLTQASIAAQTAQLALGQRR
jgi:hypothetical protein